MCLPMMKQLLLLQSNFSVLILNWGPKHAKIRVKEKVSGEVPVGYYGTAYLNYTNDNKNFDFYLMKTILSRSRG